MDLGLGGRVAIVGGSSKGMGLASAVALAREGANVTLVARNGEELEAAAAEVRAASSDGQALPIAADLAQPGDIERVVRETTGRWGRVDVVVNNLGGPPPGQPTELTDEQWQAAMDLNFYSAVRMNRLVVPLMRERAYGRVVAVLSLSIKQPEDNLALSTVSRTATAAYAKVLSTEVARDGITVNNILPGSIETGRLQAVAEMQARFHNRPMEGAMEDRQALVAARRFGQPGEVADLICFLASERAGFITGLSIPVDGGQLRAFS